MKKLRNLFVVFTMAFVLLGCYKVNMTIEVDSKGNAEMAMDFLIQESMLSYTGEDIDSLKDSATQSFSSKEKDKIKFKDLEKEIDGEKYVGFTMTYPKATAKETKKSIKVENDKVTFVMDDSYLSALGADSLTNGADMSELESAGVEFTLTVKMPGEITEASAGKIDGDKVVINLLKTDKEIKIISKNGNGNMLLYVGIGVGVVIIAAAAFFFFKKKKGNEDDAVVIISDENQQNQTSNESTLNTEETNNNEVVDAVEEIETANDEVVDAVEEIETANDEVVESVSEVESADDEVEVEIVEVEETDEENK